MSHASKTRKKLRGKRGSGGGGGGGGRGQRRSAAATVAEAAAAAAAAAKTAMQGCFCFVRRRRGGGSRKETTKPRRGSRTVPRAMSVQGVRSVHGRARGREEGPAGQQNERQGGEGLPEPECRRGRGNRGQRRSPAFWSRTPEPVPPGRSPGPADCTPVRAWRV